MTTGDSTAVRTVQGQSQGQAKAAISTGRKPARPALQLVRKVEVDRTRDALLTDFGKTTLEDRYLLPGESYQDMFARVSTAYADDADHAQRIYDYMSRLWFMPSTPVLVERRRGSRVAHLLLPQRRVRQPGWHRRHLERERVAGGQRRRHRHLLGRGALHRREGEGRGADQRHHPLHPRDGFSLTLAISQGSLRRGSAAVYLDVFHPEIEEFLEIRKPSGDFNRKSLNLHHGISITDEFMEAVRDGAQFALRSPKTHEAVKLVDARTLWQKILEIRLQTGEPYLIFSDTVNRALPQHQRELGFSVRQSNLCSEIMLHTGKDHLGHERTAVCCLSSVNAESFLEWRNEPQFIEDVMRFLDNVLQDFIDNAPTAASAASYAAMRERSVGLGLMGFHSFLQGQNVPFESALAKSWNMRIFKHLRREADKASVTLAEERGACPDAAERGVMERFSHKLAIAPTASISIICGGTSAGIEPIPANIYSHKTLSGTFAVKNPYLERVLDEKGINTEATWASILEHEGSVQHLDALSQDEKDVYKTAFELDQRWIIELAADRTPEICQSQSVNIFIPGDVDKWDLHMLHWQAWERGCKSLYYLRSKSVQRAAFAGSAEADRPDVEAAARTDYEECLACQ